MQIDIFLTYVLTICGRYFSVVYHRLRGSYW